MESISATYLTAIHPKSIVSNYAKIGEGSVVMAGAIINSDSVIGKHCIINTGAVIEHDCILEDFVHVSPNASLAGSVLVGEGTHIGIGAIVIQDVKIDADNAAITNTIITLAHNLNLQVIAEGVETSEQLNILKNLGCEMVQGYLFSKPAAPASISEFLNSQAHKAILAQDWLDKIA